MEKSFYYRVGHKSTFVFPILQKTHKKKNLLSFRENSLLNFVTYSYYVVRNDRKVFVSFVGTFTKSFSST